MDKKIRKHISGLLKINRELHEDRDETYKRQHRINKLLVEAEELLLDSDKKYDRKHNEAEAYA